MNNSSHITKSFVNFIGAGCYDPSLLTMRAYHAIQKSDVILYDALISDSFLEIFPKNTIHQYVGKRCNKHSLSQEEINQTILSYAKEGKNITRLKGGDCAIFARLTEELALMQTHNISYQIIPGISSFLAGAADLSSPLTQRKGFRELLILNGATILQENNSYWQNIISFRGTIVLFMALHKIIDICQKYLSYPSAKDKNIIMLENAGGGKKVKIQEFTLSQIAKKEELSSETQSPCLFYINMNKNNYPSTPDLSLLFKTANG